jgi:acetyl-CoA carboxylase biotin carboxyl carrier protein
MAILGFEVEEIAQLLALLQAEHWDALIVESEGRYLRIRGPRPPRKSLVITPPETSPSLPASLPEISITHSSRQKALPAGKKAAASKTAASPTALAEDQVALVSPMVGVFYRADKPGAPPLIEVGDQIAVGQTVGIIEAMKIFSEIPAEQAGVVVAIPAEDGQLVQTGAPLFILQTHERNASQP